MSYNILTIPPFDRQLKHLAKKYPSLKSEFKKLLESLQKDQKQGTPLSKNCFKIRIAIASKGKGKSGGARVITHVQVINNTIYLLTIYDKSELENVSDKEINELLGYIE